MAKSLNARQWAELVVNVSEVPARDRLVGVSITLAGRLLGVTRSRIHQLLPALRISFVTAESERQPRVGRSSQSLPTLLSVAPTVRDRNTRQ